MVYTSQNGIRPSLLRYTTLLFPGGVYQARKQIRRLAWGIQPCNFWVVYTRNRYSVPQSAGRHLSRDYQLTEYSCFHDDHASPQALIPVIPSVLVFISLAMCAIIAHFPRSALGRLLLGSHALTFGQHDLCQCLIMLGFRCFPCRRHLRRTTSLEAR